MHRHPGNEKLPESVRSQPSCATCRHCFIHHPCDDPIYYYCGLNSPPPEETSFNAFLNWRQGRETEAHFTCDEYEKGTPQRT